MAHSTMPLSTDHAHRRRLTVALYGVAVLIYWIALYLYVPTLPTYIRSKSDDLALVGVVLSMYGLWQAIVRLPLGIAADWLGRRKPFIVAGFVLVGLGAWLMGSADTVNDLILGRAVTGLAAATWVPLVAVFSTLFPPEEAVRASALLTFIGSVGRVLATGITGSLNDLGGYPLAFFLAAGAAVVAILVLLPASERQTAACQPSWGGIGRLITRRDVLLPALLSAVNMHANYAVSYGFLPILAQDLGATDVVKSFLVSLHIGLSTLGNLAAMAAVHRLGARRLVDVSFVLLALGIGGVALASSLPLLFAAQFLIGLASGVVYPVLMGLSIRFVADAERTTAMGLHQAVYAAGMFSGPWLSGLLAQALGIQTMFGLTAFACLAIGLLVARWLVVERRA
ncbi:MAG: MFS transporter [Chloroflexota bacterium]